MLKAARGSIVAYASKNTGNANGTVQRVNLYDPYGRIDGDDHVGVFSYTGQQYLPEIDLHYYKARYYHADIGRFLQTDPIGYEADMNLYGYAFNDPINFTDPNGEMPFPQSFGVSIGCGLSGGGGCGEQIQHANQSEALGIAIGGAPGSLLVPSPEDALLASLVGRAGVLFRGVPQGLTRTQFKTVSDILRNSKVAKISDDIFVQGSRAKGTARVDSDLDIGVRVSPKQFDEIIEQRLSTLQPGSNRFETLKVAQERGRIFAGEAGLSGVRRQIQRELGGDVDLSIIRQGGAFDTGPFVPIP